MPLQLCRSEACAGPGCKPGGASPPLACSRGGRCAPSRSILRSPRGCNMTTSMSETPVTARRHGFAAQCTRCLATARRQYSVARLHPACHTSQSMLLGRQRPAPQTASTGRPCLAAHQRRRRRPRVGRRHARRRGRRWSIKRRGPVPCPLRRISAAVAGVKAARRAHRGADVL